MKKIFFGGLAGLGLTVFLLAGHVYAGTETSIIQQQKYKQKYDVSFENAKLIRSHVDGKTGVKVELYDLEN